MVEASKEEQQTAAPKATGPLADEPIAPEISYDDFAKLDLRVALIKKLKLYQKQINCCVYSWIWAVKLARYSPALNQRILLNNWKAN